MAVATEFDFVVARRADAWPQTIGNWIEKVVRSNEGRLFLWLPVAMAAGIGSYFTLPVEPAALALGAILLLAGACGYCLIRGSSSPALLLLSMALAGFLAAKFHTGVFSGPSIASATETVRISGYVEQIVRGPGRSAKITLRLENVSGSRHRIGQNV